MEKAMTNRIAAFVAVVATCWSACALAQTGTVTGEDLAKCKLPNGLTILPSDGTRLARKQGSIFSFAANKLSPRPEMKGKWSAEDLVRAIGQAKAGDIMYFAAEGGGFFAMSGRITDLGKHYLHEFDGKELPRPKIITGKEGGEAVPGLMTGIDGLTGHCFILETMDRKYVLLRIVSQDRRKERRARVQWVYQPNGTRVFNVPKSKIQTQAPAVVGRPVQEGKAALSPIIKLDVRDFAKAGDTHKENRKKLVELSLALVASKDADMGNRHLACLLLGKLRAVEASAVLASNVDEDLALRATRITVSNSYRSVQALVDIGIPGSTAAIHQLERDAGRKPPKEGNLTVWNDRTAMRRRLLALVVLRVYGEKLAKVVLEDKIAQAKDPKVKAAFQQALEAFPRIKNWLRRER